MATGSIAPNFHQGSRSEVLADYLFSSWGTVTPVRRSDDYGVDLFCTLTERMGQRAFVTDYFSVQVKSTDDPWIMEGRDSVRWLIEQPTPVFLACVDKRAGILSLYKTLPRFLAGFWDIPERLELVLSQDDEGRGSQWTDPSKFELSAPILRVTLADMMDDESMARLQHVLQFWVRVDRDNCAFRGMGLLRLREPYSYRVNEIPNSGIVEQGMSRPSPAQLRLAVLHLVEAVDCVGNQLLQNADKKAGLYAALLLNHLRTARPELLADQPRWRTDIPWGLETSLAAKLHDIVYAGQQIAYTLQGLDDLIREVTASDRVAKFISE